MKKFFAGILCAAILLSAVSLSASAEDVEEVLADIVQDDAVFEQVEAELIEDADGSDFDVDETDVEIEDEPTHIKGDVNADEKVNTVDFIVLFKLFSGDDSVTYDENAIDIDGNGIKADFDDVITLMKYLAGYNVEIH